MSEVVVVVARIVPPMTVMKVMKVIEDEELTDALQCLRRRLQCTI